MSARDIPTADDIRKNPNLKNDGQRLVAIRTSIEDRLSEMQDITNATETAGAWRASDRKAFDKHSDELRTLELLGDTIKADMPDLSQVVQTGTGSDEQRGYENQGRHVSGGHTYNQDDTRTSWIKDLRSVAGNGDVGARDRLNRNNREYFSAPETRALSTTLGGIGEFTPPLWAMQLMATVARPGRVFADNINNLPLDQTMLVEIPRLVTGTAVAAQGTEGTAVNVTDATSDSIGAAVHTIAGSQVISNQLIDQSPVGLDQIVLQDLAADLAVKIDQFTLSSSATNKVGILNLSGVNTVTYTSGTPLVKEIYPKLADAIQRISTSRYMPPEKIFMHPRRWAWFEAALDSSGRPLVVPLAQMPQNAIAQFGGVRTEGLVGSLMGLPIYTDPSIPVNTGSGTNQDPVLVSRTSDSYLWESPVMVQPDRLTLSNQLQTRITISRYVAVQHGRYPLATAVINGTGLITPTF